MGLGTGGLLVFDEIVLSPGLDDGAALRTRESHRGPNEWQSFSVSLCPGLNRLGAEAALYLGFVL